MTKYEYVCKIFINLQFYFKNTFLSFVFFNHISSTDLSPLSLRILSSIFTQLHSSVITIGFTFSSALILQIFTLFLLAHFYYRNTLLIAILRHHFVELDLFYSSRSLTFVTHSIIHIYSLWPRTYRKIFVIFAF